MHRRNVSTHIATLLASILVVGSGLALAAEEQGTQTTPTPAKKTLTDEQKKTAQQFGLNPNAGGVDVILSRLTGGCDFDPYTRLEQYKSGNNVQLTPRAGGGSDLKQGINPTLACRLVKFFEFANQKGCSIRITSAYRSEDQQAEMCGAGRTGCAPAGRSCHQYGLAVDITSSCTGFLRQYLGTKNPNAPGAQAFKLHFPYSGDHIQCIENTQAACSPGTKQCDGMINIASEPGRGVPQPPTAQWTNQLRQWLTPQQQPAQQLPQTMQPLPQTQGITNAFKEPTQQSAPSVSDSLVKNSEKATSTTADKLEELAFGKKTDSPATTITATSVPIYLDTSDVGGIASKGLEEPVTATAGIGGSVTQSTFESNAEEWGKNQATLTGFQAILASIRQRLLAMLVYLKPFGRAGEYPE